MSQPDLAPAIPILRMFDERSARAFYLDFLGFTVEWEHRFEPDTPLYMQIRLGKLVLHLSEHHGDATPGSTVFVPVTGIRAWQQQLLATQYKYARPGVQDLPWGAQMDIADPFGNRLRFCELNEE